MHDMKIPIPDYEATPPHHTTQGGRRKVRVPVLNRWLIKGNTGYLSRAKEGRVKDTVVRFVQAFQKAVRVEMEAMRQRMGPFEVPVGDVRKVDVAQDAPHHAYALVAAAANDKLVLNGECTLAHDSGELLVTIIALEGNHITIRCNDEVPLHASPYVLVIYPWFLYQRLLLVLESLPESGDFHAQNALALFGKVTPTIRPQPGAIRATNINSSQDRAIRLCRDSSLAFVWGPPGTGKTTTLGHIVVELLGAGHRILVTSTTNAAVDQALAKLASIPAARERLSRGEIVRVGQTDAPTYGASLGEVVQARNRDLLRRLAVLKDRQASAADKITACHALLAKLRVARREHQLDLFVDTQRPLITRMDIGTVFGSRLSARVQDLSPTVQQACIEARLARLRVVKQHCQERMAICADALRGREQKVIGDARVVLATMTNMYISQLLAHERYDVVIVEEAGMAVLPVLFFCAGLSRDKVIAIGDPRQLPPIVQSSNDYVRRAMGRSIFQVTVPEPDTSDVVVMLDTQYRMHPTIGTLVSETFYDGRLRNAESTAERRGIAGKAPFPGQPLTVVDTAGTSSCTTAEGSYSRLNRKTAELCVLLAAEAVESGVESIAIVTPYVQQSRLIRTLLADARVPAERVECRTVHRFQGNERDMVILDTVDSDPMRPGVLLSGRGSHSSAPNLLNVSISRAKGKLVIVADVSYFRTNAPGSIIDRVLASAVRAGYLHTGEV